MAKRYHLDVARWEGEGGATPEGPALSDATGWVATRRRSRSLAVLQILSGVLIGVALVYARRKTWI
jgi:hypothetical protein